MKASARAASGESGAEIPPLSGWSGIQYHLSQHDVVMVKDHADDIDTLLVFAGLFSAVLTAFVVETYTLLLEDPNTQTAGTNGNSSGSIYVPSSSARWINSLFFISLVLSLSAAFFGILAKQWLREYMLWNSPLDAPRENVLVRQLRYEAWEAWNLPTTISCIPVILELSMILFLVGVDILLWTLDNVVAMTVTVFVGLFIGSASAFTILPAIYRRCPYKSPTAWAIAAVFDAAVRATQKCQQAAAASLKWKDFCCSSTLRPADCYARSATDAPSPRTQFWRHRDLEHWRRHDLKLELPWNEAHQNPEEAARSELAKEYHHISTEGDTFIGDPGEFSYRLTDESARALVADIGETAVLLRSLLWVQRGSQNTQIGRCIDQCMESIHPTIPPNSTRYLGPVTIHQLRTVSNWCILTSLQNDLACQFSPSLPVNPPRYDGTNVTDVTSLRCATGIRAYYCSVLYGPSYSYRFFQQTHRVSPFYVWPHSQARFVVFPLLVSHLRHSLSDLEVKLIPDWTTDSNNRNLDVRRILELFSILTEMARKWSLCGSEWYRDVLRSILLCSEPVERRLCSQASGLRFDAFKLACASSEVRGNPDNGSLVISSGSTRYQDYESILLYHLGADFETYGRDDYNMFASAAVAWLYEPSSTYTRPGPSEGIKIIALITQALSALSDRATPRMHERHFPDDSDWVHAFRFWLTHWRKRANRLTQETPAVTGLAHAFQRAYSRYALCGDQSVIWKHLHHCLKVSHSVEKGACPEGPSCLWSQHVCDEESQNCSLLLCHDIVAVSPIAFMDPMKQVVDATSTLERQNGA